MNPLGTRGDYFNISLPRGGLERLSDRFHNRAGTHWFAIEAKSLFPQSLNNFLRRGFRFRQQNLGFGANTVNSAEQLQPIHTGHVQAGEYEIKRSGLYERQPVRTPVRTFQMP